MTAPRAPCRRLLWLLLVIGTLCAGACRQPSTASSGDASPGDAGPTPTGSAPPVADSAVADKLRLELDALTNAALAQAGARTGPPSVSPIQYQRNPCALTYAFRARLDMTTAEMPQGMGDRGLEWDGRFEVRAGKTPDRIEIATTEESTRHVVGGRRNPGNTVRPTDGPVHLSGDGRSWRLEEPTSHRWDGMGSFWGLIIQWPALPAESAPGSRAPWALTQAVSWSASTVDAKRYPLPPRPAGLDQPASIDAEVRVLRTLDVGGVPAIVLEAAGSNKNEVEMPGFDVGPDAGPLGGMKMSSAVTFRGQYVVLGSGRLLHAAFRMDTDATMDFGDLPSKTTPSVMHQHHAHLHEARLVAGCDGPVLPEFAPRTPTDQEVALESIVRFRNAVVMKDRKAVVKELASSLLSQHGEAKVVAALFRIAEQHGLSIFGVPELADEGTTRGSEVRFRLSGSSLPADPKTPRVHVGRLDYVAEVSAGQARIVSIEMDDIGKHRLFELTPARFVDAVRPNP